MAEFNSFERHISNKIDNYCHKSIIEIQEILYNLDNVEFDKLQVFLCMKNTLGLLESIHQCNINSDVEEIEIKPNDVMPLEVANWIQSTFSRSSSSSVNSSSGGLERFRSAANYIKTGLAIEKVMCRPTNSNLSSTNEEQTKEYLKKNMDCWTVNMFELDEMTGGKCLTDVIGWVLDDCQFLEKYQIPELIFQNFVICLEEGYSHYSNPYHNSLHAADVVQTCYHFINFCGLSNHLTELEIFSLIFAAMIHDFRHTGTTNLFHINTRSELAIVYNDKSVLENYHLSRIFQIFQDPNLNILTNFSAEEYQEVRNLTIEMVLNTDMNLHSHQLKLVKTKLNMNEKIEKSKLLSLILHCADISHPSKQWDVHYKWTMRLLDEFFLQGDKERSLNLPISPLCDRNNTLINDSQIGFLDYIVIPTFEIVDQVLRRITTDDAIDEESSMVTPWKHHMFENKQRWQKLSIDQS